MVAKKCPGSDSVVKSYVGTSRSRELVIAKEAFPNASTNTPLFSIRSTLTCWLNPASIESFPRSYFNKPFEKTEAGFTDATAVSNKARRCRISNLTEMAVSFDTHAGMEVKYISFEGLKHLV